MNKSIKFNRKVVAVLVLGLVTGCSSISSSKFALWGNKDSVASSKEASQPTTAEGAELTKRLEELTGLTTQLKDYIAHLTKLLDQQKAVGNPPADIEAAHVAANDTTAVVDEPLYNPESKAFHGMKLSMELGSVGRDTSNIAATEKTAPVVLAQVEPATSAAAVVPELQIEALPTTTYMGKTDKTPAPQQALGEQQKAVEAVAEQEGGTVFRVGFPFGSSEFVMNAEVEKNLLKAVAESKRIEIRGYTDAEVSTVHSERIAAERARAAYQYLIKRGVPADKLSVSSVGAQSFYVENMSDDGRAKNRRVEIVVSNSQPQRAVAARNY